MTTRAKTWISVVVALIILGSIVFANRVKAPEDGAEATLPAVEPASAETPTTTAGTKPGASTSQPITIRSFTLRIGQPATVDGYKFALRNIEDSRCPDGAQCIRAGEAKSFIQVEYGANKREIVATSNGEWVTVGARQVRATKVLPAYPTQITGAYIVFLEVRRS